MLGSQSTSLLKIGGHNSFVLAFRKRYGPPSAIRSGASRQEVGRRVTKGLSLKVCGLPQSGKENAGDTKCVLILC
jgi:hypothetical protein